MTTIKRLNLRHIALCCFYLLFFIYSTVPVYSEPVSSDSLKKISESFPKSMTASDSTFIKDTINFSTKTYFNILGSAIGLNSMHSVDIDHDGIIDLICSASNSTWGHGNLWYILNYDPVTKKYFTVWNSAPYSSLISVINTFDLNGDGNYEVVVGLENGNIQLIDGATRELKTEVKIDYNGINSINFGDADNDTHNELIISTLSSTFILDPLTLKTKFTISKGSSNALVGNIDDNLSNEIVLSTGSVYRIVNDSVSKVKELTDNFNGKIELADLDNDSKLEVVLAHNCYGIDIIDADSNKIKKTFPANHDISALLVQDVNGDGKKEIIYGDGQWGSVHCLNSVTGEELWSVENPGYGVTNINVADLDKDGNLELIWAAGYNDSGDDYLYVYDLKNKTTDWRNKYIFGPFTVVKTGDINGDHIDDIVSIGEIYNDLDYMKAIIVIDGSTGKLLWEDNNLINNDEFGDFSIKDINNDGFGEIVVACNGGGTRFLIVNGKDFSYKYISSMYPVQSIGTMLIEDVNNDGKLEIVAANPANIFLVNPYNWSILKTIPIPNPNSGDLWQPLIKHCDINGDGKKELVFCNGLISIVNMNNYSVTQTTDNDFVNTDIFDYNKDGINDIIACTTNGEIGILNGRTLSYINLLKPENSRIESVRTIVSQNDIVFIYSYDGRINFYINNYKRIVSQYFGDYTANKEGMQFLQTANGKVLIFGTSTSILSIPPIYYPCASMEIGIEKNEVSCGLKDGYINLNVKGGSGHYSYLWNNNSTLSSLNGLVAGKYSVKISDDAKCVKTRRFDLKSAYIDISANVQNLNCKTKGAIELTVNHLTEPYSIKWSDNSSNLNKTGLNPGFYSVEIADSKNCHYQQNFSIKADTIDFNNYVRDISCFSKNDGYISIYTSNYYGNFQYLWNNGTNYSYLSNLSDGNYSVIITDMFNCTKQLQFEIHRPTEINYDISTYSDNILTYTPEGKAKIKDITGGTFPYRVYWPAFSRYSDSINGMVNGAYSFSVIDGKNCTVKDTAVIDENSAYFEDFGLSLNNKKVIANKDTCFDAFQTIELAKNNGLFEVDSLAKVSLIAGIKIIMNSGTHIKNGAVFCARITSEDCFCPCDLISGSNDPKSSWVNDSSISLLWGKVDRNNKIEFTAYPNPTSDKFRISLNNSNQEQDLLINIYNLYGQMVKCFVTKDIANMEFSLKDRIAGVYFIKLRQGKFTGISRIIKYDR
jgi:hypothetical protein